MDEKEKKFSPETDEDTRAASFTNTADTRELPNRRELIERYGKYAVVAAPLLLFATKAHAHPPGSIPV